MNRFRSFILMLVLLVVISGLVQAQVSVVSAQGETEPSDGFVELVMSGEAEPVPALQYRLLPPIEDLKSGNAALEWFKLVFTIPPDVIGRYEPMKDGPVCIELLEMSFDRFKNEYLDRADSFYKVSQYSFLEHAANCEKCDWNNHFEDGLNMHMPGLTELKRIARLVALEARVEVAKGNYARAIELLSYNYSLAEDLGKGKSVIQALTGMAIAFISNEIVEDIVLQPDCPNLFWALQMMPSPLIDIRQAYEAEMSLMMKVYVDDLKTSILTLEQANKRFQELYEMFDGASNAFPLAVNIATKYIPSKKYLLENGYDAKRLDLMPATQVILLKMWHEYIPIRDEYFKIMFVPYHKATPFYDKIADKVTSKRSELVDNIFIESLPIGKDFAILATRNEVKADALQCVEAIQMYVAKNGKLPEKLADIDFIPLPENEFTGEEFKYYLDGDSAVLDVEDPEDDYDFQGYRLRLR